MYGSSAPNAIHFAAEAHDRAMRAKS